MPSRGTAGPAPGLGAILSWKYWNQDVIPPFSHLPWTPGMPPNFVFICRYSPVETIILGGAVHIHLPGCYVFVAVFGMASLYSDPLMR